MQHHDFGKPPREPSERPNVFKTPLDVPGIKMRIGFTEKARPHSLLRAMDFS